MIMDKKTAIENLAREAHEKGAFNGAWLYAEGGKIVSRGAYGFQDAEDRLPMRENSLFHVASISKQFTAAAILLLRRRGLLSLDDEITRFFPELPYPGVTIRHLLTHTNGLPDYTAWAKETIQREGAILDNEILLRFLRESGAAPEFAPGDRYSYGNTDYCLLAELIKQLSGVSFEEFLQTEIFEPAGMSVTRVGRPTIEEGAYGNLACGLVLDNGNYMLPENAAFDYMVPLFDQLRGCGNVYSNVDDLFAWDRALRQENVLTKEEQREMATPVMLNDGTIASDDGNGYGFGWSIEDDPVLGSIVGHDGNWDGYMGWYERFLDADRLLIFLTSRVPADVRAYVGFLDGMKAAARDKEPEAVRSLEELAIPNPDCSDWKRFCGTYASDNCRIEVFSKGNELFAAFRYKNGFAFTAKMMLLGEKTFGIKDDLGEMNFADDGLSFWDEPYQKL